MRKIKFLGASGQVTGSSYLITAQDGTQVLVDFGMFQGAEDIVKLNYEPLKFDPSLLTGVILTHAHLDHCGRLPMLTYSAFKGKIFMTEPTLELTEVVLSDAARIAQEKVTHEPLYGLEEVEKTLQMVETVGYDQAFTIGGFSIRLKDAGHILGSASIEITDTTDQKKIVVSGDLGNTPEDIVQPTSYIDAADVVVMETTYGNKIHPAEDPSLIIMEEIQKVEETSGVLLIPAFSLERTQEILHRIYHLKKDGKIRPDTPVFLDSPMGIRATEIFRQFKEFYNDELQSHIDDPFGFEGLAVTAEARDSKEIIKAMEPKVIIAGSGMMSGGRILHHAMYYLPDVHTRLLFVGYQAEETLGRQILGGARKVVINDKTFTVRASVRSIATMSSHADQTKLLKWLGHMKGVSKVFLIHGEQLQRQAFRDKAKNTLHIPSVFLPAAGEEHEW